MSDYWGSQSVELNTDEPVEVDLNGVPVAPVAAKDAVLKTEFDAKGDLLVGTGNDTYDNLPAGTTGQALVVNPANPTGLGWATPASATHTHVEADITDFAHTHVEADLPATLATDAEVTSAISTHAAAADPHTGYQRESEKAAANGYASLDANTRVPSAQLGTGTASSTTYLRGDRTWATIAESNADALVWMGGM